MKYEILVVDDDQSQHEIVGDYLEMAGYKVVHAFNGAEALECVEQQKPDLILLDVRMPVMDGFETLRKLQARPDCRHIPVLFLTSLGQTNLKVKGLELGAEDYIIKPFVKAELFARLRAALRRTARYRENLSSMQGDLRDFGMVELLQTFDISGSAVQIKFEDMQAELEIANSQILFTRMKNFKHLDALKRMIILNRGMYTVSFVENDTDELLESVKIQNALMDSVTFIDEMFLILAKVGKPEDIIEFTDVDFEEDGFEEVKHLGPVVLKEMLCMLSGDLKERAGQLVKLVRENRVKITS